MEATSPYKVFNTWLFDNNRTSQIPKAQFDSNGKEIVPDILKYNSPISQTYVVSLFMRYEKLNHYLNDYFNDINLRYLSREELFKFIKKCVIDFRVRRGDLVFYPRKERFKLYEALRERMPFLKNDDVFLLCDIVDRSDLKEGVYQALDLEKPKKFKVKKADKKNKNEKVSLPAFLEEHFSISR